MRGLSEEELLLGYDECSSKTNAAQGRTPAIRVTFQETPMIGTYLMNIREGRKPKNI